MAVTIYFRKNPISALDFCSAELGMFFARPAAFRIPTLPTVSRFGFPTGAFNL